MSHASWVMATLLLAGACAAERASNKSCQLASGAMAGAAGAAGCKDFSDLTLCTEPDAGPDCWNPFSVPSPNDAGTAEDSCGCPTNVRQLDAASAEP
jgi:hypothetical protein